MIRLHLQFALAYDVLAQDADFLLCIHAARTPHQQVTQELLTITPPSARWEVQNGLPPGGRCLRLHAQPGPLEVRYAATVDIQHHVGQPAQIAETPIQALPLDVLHYIYPSRYCQSDRLANFAMTLFGQMAPGYARAQAICAWVQQHVTFRSNSSVATTSALDTLIARAGVCRDFAHLMIALCRAVNLPARFVTGTDYGADPALGPPDFHAYVEVYLGGRWYLFDPSGTAIPMGLMRLATGRDAADVAFATIFGSITSAPPHIRVRADSDAQQGWVLPSYTPLALSTACADSAAGM